jgi:tetratricopeptide (TPR) repeat protein
MLSELAGREVPAALAEAVFRETEGNPFFVEEVFRHFVEEGRMFDDTGAFRPDIEINELDVPESVRLVVGRRLERLGPEAHKALAAAAVVGRGFSFRLWEAVADIDAGALLDIVDEAEGARVIVPEEREGDAHYTFAHELIRQTLLSSLTIPRRQRLHLAVANAMELLESRAAEMRPSEIATHLLEAGVAADADRTIDALTRAADRAFEAAAFEDSARFVESALELLDPDEALRRVQLLERLGQTRRAGGDIEEALATFRSVIASYRELGEAEAAGRLCFDAGYLLTFLGRFQEAIVLNNEGIELLADRVVAERANLLAGSAAIMSIGGFPHLAEDRFVQAETIADQLGPAVQGRVAWLRCVNRQAAGDLVGSAEAGRRAADFLRTAGDLWTLADALAWWAFALVNIGHYEEAAARAEEAIDVATRTGHTTAAALATRPTVLWALRMFGDLEEYEAAARRDIELFERSPLFSQSYTWLGVATQLRGRMEESITHHDRACELELPSAYVMAWAYRALNRALAGAHDACRGQLAERIGELTDAKAVPTLGPYHARLAAAEAVAIVGEAHMAGDLYPIVCANLAEPVMERFWDGAVPSRLAGMLASTVGAWPEAEAHFEYALEAASTNILDAPQIRYWYGKMLADRGLAQDQPRANKLIVSALTEYERLGMPVHAAMARELLRVHA